MIIFGAYGEVDIKNLAKLSIILCFAIAKLISDTVARQLMCFIGIGCILNGPSQNYHVVFIP